MNFRLNAGLFAIVTALVTGACGGDESGNEPVEDGGADASMGGSGAASGTGGGAGSGGSAATTGTGGGGADAGVPDAQANDAGPPVHRGFVVTLRLPQNAAEQPSHSLDIDGDSFNRNDNLLGSVAATLAGADVTSLGDNVMAFEQGDIIELLSITSAFVNGVRAQAVLRRGENPSVAPCSIGDAAACGQHLLPGTSFDVLAADAALPELVGTFIADRVDAGPGPLRVSFVILGQTVVLNLVAGRMEMDFVTDTQIAGKLGGAIPEAELNSLVFPALTAGLNALLDRDCPANVCASGSAGENIATVVDTDDDFTLTLSEFQNSVFGAVLTPDLDLLDASGQPGVDGTNDHVSIGFRVDGAPATFAAP